MANNLMFPPRIVDAGPNAGIYMGGPRDNWDSPRLSIEMLAKARRAAAFFRECEDDPTDYGPDPDYGF